MKEEILIPLGAVESAMHLIDGLISKPNDSAQILEIWDRGCCELYYSMIEYAEECDRLFKQGLQEGRAVPAVFDYEVSCTFGAWYGQYITTRQEMPDRDSALEMLRKLNTEFWNQ